MNAGRANISLFDRTHQHIVAEALRPIPSELEEKQQPAWFNGLTFERESSICEHVVTGSAGSQFVPGTDFGLSVDDIPVSIIKSLDTDARFCHIQDPGRQFYAGVPIRSPEGINIGVYCVFDDMPRPQGLTDDEIRFIREISRVVMDYLEIKRSSEWHRREQRMLRGLGSFVRGKPTLWKPAEGALDNHVSIRDRPGISEGQLNKKLQSGRTQAGDGQEKQQEQEKPEPETPGSEIPTAEHHSPGQNGADAPLITTARTDFAEVLDNPTTPTKRLKLARVLSSSADQLSNKMDDVFSKAANVIRESVEIEGVLFLDAAVHSYGGLVGSVSSNTPNQSGGRHSSTTQSSGYEAVRNPNCNVLGFSTSRTSSVVGDAIPNEFTRCREWFLQRLLQRYPLGNVWNFDADGSVSDHTTDSEDSPIPGRKMHTSPAATEPINEAGAAVAPHKTKKRISTAARIVEMFPGARSVAVVPLWDAQTGRWFAGGFAWTQTPTRTFSEENELIYMRVFGLAAMTEIARLKMRAADKAKTDILGSISHELRSPLHGLVGAVELLRHTDLDALQDGILRTIEASGRTLLDTIDHVSFARYLL